MFWHVCVCVCVRQAFFYFRAATYRPAGLFCLHLVHAVPVKTAGRSVAVICIVASDYKADRRTADRSVKACYEKPLFREHDLTPNVYGDPVLSDK